MQFIKNQNVVHRATGEKAVVVKQDGSALLTQGPGGKKKVSPAKDWTLSTNSLDYSYGEDDDLMAPGKRLTVKTILTIILLLVCLGFGGARIFRDIFFIFEVAGALIILTALFVLGDVIIDRIRK